MGIKQRVAQADRVLIEVHLITMSESDRPYGLIRDGVLAIKDGQISWLGSAREVGIGALPPEVIRCDGRFLTPGLIDCHTHIVWGGSRAQEWERRLSGVSYQEIAEQGGGILSTVSATRDADEAELYSSARNRVEFLMQQGVTGLEIKSGYGLDTESELKILRVATDLRDSMPIDVARTLLGAHALPTEYADRSDDYIELVCAEMIPRAKNDCEFVDVFCESIGFTRSQSKKVLEAAVSNGLKPKIHAEQLSNLGCAKMAASMGALSADHLEYLDEEGVVAMARNGTIAVLLPGAFYFIHETQLPPVELLRQHQVPMAIATDANPGSSPAANLLLMMNMACTLFRLTPAEALAGVTRNAARALDWQDRLGTLEVGKQADLVLWDIESPAELAYGIGHNPCAGVFKQGEFILDMT